jgi:hypothetical protein
MLVICVAIFIGYIWPEINNIKVANDEKKANTQALNDADIKKADVNAVISQISTNPDDKQIVDNYLPNSNMEERVIGGINYLASDAGISLINISMTKPPENTSTSVTSIATDNNTNGSSSPDDKPINKIQFNEATVSVSGEYDKLNLFIDNLQKMALFNSIKSLTITNSTAEDLSNAVPAETGQTSDSKILTAEIVVNFGYLKETTDYSDSQIAKLDTKLDSGTIDVLKLYLAQKDVSVISETGEAAGPIGKKNPFFLE